MAYKPHLPENILPLDANNDVVIKQMIAQGELSVVGLDLTNLVSIRISMPQKDGYRIFRIQGEERTELIFKDFKDYQIKIILSTLRQMRIRLFLFKDAGQLSFWGGTFAIDSQDDMNY